MISTNSPAVGIPALTEQPAPMRRVQPLLWYFFDFRRESATSQSSRRMMRFLQEFQTGAHLTCQRANSNAHEHRRGSCQERVLSSMHNKAQLLGISDWSGCLPSMYLVSI